MICGGITRLERESVEAVKQVLIFLIQGAQDEAAAEGRLTEGSEENEEMKDVSETGEQRGSDTKRDESYEEEPLVFEPSHSRMKKDTRILQGQSSQSQSSKLASSSRFNQAEAFRGLH